MVPYHEYSCRGVVVFKNNYIGVFFRAAKRNTDEKSFYGGILHVCYAPEYETVEDIRKKLQDRRSYINRTCNKSGNK